MKIRALSVKEFLRRSLPLLAGDVSRLRIIRDDRWLQSAFVGLAVPAAATGESWTVIGPARDTRAARRLLDWLAANGATVVRPGVGDMSPWMPSWSMRGRRTLSEARRGRKLSAKHRANIRASLIKNRERAPRHEAA